MYAIAGASGQLGRLVIDELLQTIPARDIVALARDPAKIGDLAERGVVVRTADYDRPETLVPALAGISRLLLISGNAVGMRLAQHRAVIAAAKSAGVGFIVYTSILNADRSTIGLAEEHRQTEAAIRESGLGFALLRNGWYKTTPLRSPLPSNSARSSAHPAMAGSRRRPGVISPQPRPGFWCRVRLARSMNWPATQPSPCPTSLPKCRARQADRLLIRT